MMTLAEARARVDPADIVIMVIVELLRGLQEPQDASPTGVNSNIPDAPLSDIRLRMFKLANIGLLDRRPRQELPNYRTYVVSQMGAQLLSEDAGGWEPARREQERRDRELLEATGGRLI